MPVNEFSVLGGLASGLVLSLLWPFCFQRQYGINGCPCQSTLCKFDCGWIGENDHEFFGTEEDRHREEEAERARRLAWANHLVAQREQERLRDAMGKITHVRQNFKAKLWTEGTGYPPTQMAVGAVAGAGVGAMKEGVVEENLDDKIGGSRIREPKRGSVLFDGPGGVDERPGNRRSRSGRSDGRSPRSSVVPAFVGVSADIEGTEDTPLNRGRMAPQTIVVDSVQQRQYNSTMPMTIPTRDEEEDETLVESSRSKKRE